MELNEAQKDCDHDWEYFDTTKQCTYAECQLELKLTKSDYYFVSTESDGGN